VTRSQTTRNRRFHPWPLRLSGNKARPDQAARRRFHHWSFFDRAAQAASIEPGVSPSQSHAVLPRTCKGGEQHHHQKRLFRGMLVCADTAPNRVHRRCLQTGTFRSNGVVPEDRIRDRGPETPRLSGDQKHSPDCNHQTRPEPPASFKQAGHTGQGAGPAQSGRQGRPRPAGRSMRRMGRFLYMSYQTCIKNRIFLT